VPFAENPSNLGVFYEVTFSYEFCRTAYVDEIEIVSVSFKFFRDLRYTADLEKV